MIPRVPVLCLAAMFSVAVHAQTDSCSITGMVIDPAQAAMRQVNVTARNTDTNIVRSMKTNEDGLFTLTNLPPGPYELVAELPGFRTQRETGIVLEIGQVLRVDIKMTVGSVNESVSVKAEVASLNTENGAVTGDVIAQAEIQELPLNGRDFTDLAFLVSGVVPNAQGGAGSAMSINGARADNTNYYVDGFNDRNARGANAQFRPNLDAMQEFKMETSGFSAEYGRMAGGVMNMVLRSGANRYHASLFENFRNDVFDARSFFDPAKLDFHVNQFGATISGPVVIPHVYDGHDRTFFLVSYEGLRQTSGESRLSNVPTLLERSGNFSKTVDNAGKPVTVKNPFNKNAAFPGNIIPESMFNPVSLRLLGYYPLPNRPNAQNNYVAVAQAFSDFDSPLFKVDHRFSSTDSVALRYGKRFAQNNAPWGGTNLGSIWGNDILDDRSLGGLDYTHLFSSTLLMESRVGVSRNSTREHTASAGTDYASQLGVQGSTKDPLLTGFPVVTLLNYTTMGAATGQPQRYFVTDFQVATKFNWVRSKHILKWGFDFSKLLFNQPYYNNARGTLGFQANWTGYSMGDYLLGLLQSSSISQQSAQNYVRSNTYGLFINDDYKILSSLTLNIGLRYELDSPPAEKYDRVSNFVPGINKIVISDPSKVLNYDALVQQAKLTALVAPRSAFGFPSALIYTNKLNFAPRLGIAWRPLGSQRMVVRTGYGVFYSGSILNDIRLNLMTGFPFTLLQNFTRVASNVNALVVSNPFPQALATLGGTTASNGYEMHAPAGYLHSYNFTVEREVGRGQVLEVGYVGSKGTHLGRQYDINAPIRTQQEYQATGTFPRPVSALNVINYYSFGSNSSYNAGSVTLRRRSSTGFFYRVSYIWSRSIDDASQLSGASAGGFSGALDPRNLRLERARSDFDRSHALNASWSYMLPITKWRPVLGGWQLTGTAALTTGQPFTVETANVNTAIGDSLRPNRLGSGIQPDIAGAGKKGVDYPYFNIADFEAVPACASRTVCLPSPHGFLPFGPGNSGRNILTGPGTAFVNSGLAKTFSLGEKGRIQFRWEAFNLANHPNFQLPNRVFDAKGGGIITGVTATGRGGPRSMQFVLRYTF